MNKEINKKQRYTSVMASFLAASQIFLLTGCNNCKIKKEHAHIYDSDYAYRRYIISDKSKYDRNWYKTDDYIIVDDDMEELIKYERDNNLYRIDLNQDKIEEITTTHMDHLEYQYEYMKPGLIIGPVILPEDGYSWTPYEDLYDSLTGETRMVHFMYYGYKVYKNKDGEYEKVKSELVDNIYDLPIGYDYITPCFYTLVDPDTKEELDYGTKDKEEVLIYGDYSSYRNDKSKVKVLEKKIYK